MSILAVALVLAAQQAGPAPAARRPITETDLFRFVWIADPQISPDGADVAFVRVAVNKKKDGYDTALWIVPADGSAPAAAVHERAARHRAALVAGRPAAGLPARGREGRQAAAAADPPDGARGRRGAGDHRPAQGRERAGVVARRPHPRLHEHDQREGPGGAREGSPRRRGGRARERRARDHAAVYRWNGGGYVDFARPSHVWTVARARRRRRRGAAAPGHQRRLRRGRAGLVARTGRGSSSRRPASPSRTTRPSDEDLFAVAADGGAPALVASIDGSIGAAAPSPDGRRIAFRGTLNGKPLRSYDQPDLFVVDVAGGAAAEPDRGARLRRAERAGRRPAGAARRGQARHRLAAGTAAACSSSPPSGAAPTCGASTSPTGRLHDVTAGDQEVMSFSASADGSRIVALVSTADGDRRPVRDRRQRRHAPVPRPRRLTRVNAALFARAGPDRRRRRSGTRASTARRSTPWSRSRPASIRRSAIR